MGLLALQFGLQPLFTRGFVGSQADKVPLVLACEILKCIVAFALLVTEGGAQGIQAIRQWTLSESLKSGAVPAAIYAVQNVFIQIGYQNMSGLMFNLLNQTKIIFTAVMVFAFTSKRQSPMQIVALLMVLFVGVTLCVPKASDTNDLENQPEFMLGIIPTLIASLLSGVAAGWSQRVMQGKARRNAYLFSAELSFFSSICLAAKMISVSGVHVSVERMVVLFQENNRCWIPLLTNAVGGIFVGQVIKHAGGVSKSFSIIFGIVLTGLVEWQFFGAALSPRTGFCLPVIVVAMYIYVTNPSAKAGGKLLARDESAKKIR